MLRWLTCVLGVGLFTVGANTACSSQPKAPWTGDYEAAKKEARRTNKPLLVVFRCVP